MVEWSSPGRNHAELEVLSSAARVIGRREQSANIESVTSTDGILAEEIELWLWVS